RGNRDEPPEHESRRAVQLGGGLRELRLLRGPRSRGRGRSRVTIASHPVQARRGRPASPPLSTSIFSRTRCLRVDCPTAGRLAVRGAGVEPASEAWKASVLPLDYPRAVGVKRRQLKNPMGRVPPGIPRWANIFPP